jgi:peptidoglycan-associated lipoprotein
MIDMNRAARIALLLLGTAAVAGCPRRRTPPPPATPPVNTDSIAAADRARRDSMNAANAARARADSIARADQARRDAAERERMERERLMTEARNAVSARIYFEYDAAELSEQARATLDAKVPLLNANPGLRIRVAGHTDDRGSDEYNLALGQRRAAAAKRYLVQRGIDAERIEVISLGEEQPATPGSDESAWSLNRRAEFEITAGGDTIVLPNR